MNWKKLALAGVMALVIIGCIATAGCTNYVNEFTQTQEVNGTVVSELHSGTTADGVTVTTYTENGKTTEMTSTSPDIIGTWKYDVTSDDVEDLENNIPSLTKVLKEAGLAWTDVTRVFIFKDDGTAEWYEVKKSDGSRLWDSALFNWEYLGANKYALIFDNGDSFEARINPIKGTMTIETIEDMVFQKQPSDASGFAMTSD